MNAKVGIQSKYVLIEGYVIIDYVRYDEPKEALIVFDSFNGLIEDIVVNRQKDSDSSFLSMVKEKQKAGFKIIDYGTKVIMPGILYR